MTEFPALPEHYIKRIVSNMLPDDIYYLDSETMAVDRQTLRPFFNKYTPVSIDDRQPNRLIGRYGLMRVFDNRSTPPIDGYVVDMRFIDSDEIEQDDLMPPEDADYDTKQELAYEYKDYISPLGILACAATTNQEILLGDESIRPYLLHLCTNTDQIHERIASRPSLSRRRRKNVPTNKKTYQTR